MTGYKLWLSPIHLVGEGGISALRLKGDGQHWTDETDSGLLVTSSHSPGCTPQRATWKRLFGTESRAGTMGACLIAPKSEAPPGSCGKP